MAADAEHDGNEILGQCQQCQQCIKFADSERVGNYVDACLCVGYVQGVVSTVYFYSDELKKDAKYCLSGNVTNPQLVRIVVKYLKYNPNILNESRMALVWRALKGAHPCK